MAVYWALRNHFGFRNWWPGRTRFEIIVGAILTQNTAWRNVEKALNELRRTHSLSMKAMRELPEAELADRIRSSGYYNQKARKLKAFISFVDQTYAGSLKRMANEETPVLREALLRVKGIGPETADSILLYAFDHPSFVIDAYTYRVLTRHGWLPEGVSYAEMKAFFEQAIAPDVELYNDYHAQLVAVGHHFCRKTAHCDGCPLEPWLPRRKRRASVNKNQRSA